MSRVRVHNCSVSLDGFGAGEGQSLDAPFGHAGDRLQQWLFATRTFRAMHGQPGGSTGVDDAFASNWGPGIGAEIMGPGQHGADASSEPCRRTRQPEGRRAGAACQTSRSPHGVWGGGVVFQFGWGRSLLGVSENVPAEAYVPMIMFAIVFGLPMDCEVFLMSRVKKAWDGTRDHHEAVASGWRAPGGSSPPPRLS